MQIPWEINKKYFIRTVSTHLIGELKFISDKELLLQNGSWVAYDFGLHYALKTGKLSDVEPFINDVIVNRDNIVDATEWNHDLLDRQI